MTSEPFFHSSKRHETLLNRNNQFPGIDLRIGKISPELLLLPDLRDCDEGLPQATPVHLNVVVDVIGVRVVIVVVGFNIGVGSQARQRGLKIQSGNVKLYIWGCEDGSVVIEVTENTWVRVLLPTALFYIYEVI